MEACSLHIACRECGYDLFTLDLAGCCPECGCVVSKSLDPRRLRVFSRPVLRLVWLASASWVGAMSGLTWLVVLMPRLFVLGHPYVERAIEVGVSVLWGAAALFIARAYARCRQSSRARLVSIVLAATGLLWAMHGIDQAGVRMGWLSPWHYAIFPRDISMATSVGSFAGFHVALAELLDLLPRRWCSILLRLVGAIGLGFVIAVGSDATAPIAVVGFLAVGGSLAVTAIALVVVWRISPIPGMQTELAPAA